MKPREFWEKSEDNWFEELKDCERLRDRTQRALKLAKEYLFYDVEVMEEIEAIERGEK